LTTITLVTIVFSSSIPIALCAENDSNIHIGEKTIEHNSFDGGMAEKVEINPLNFFFLLPFHGVFYIEFVNNNNVTIQFHYNMTVIKPDGAILFNFYSGTHYPLTVLPSGWFGSRGFPYTRLDFIKKGYGIGFFTVEVEIEVVEDHSFKSETFTGFILSFLFSWIW
jgi:hypothetical protein